MTHATSDPGTSPRTSTNRSIKRTAQRTPRKSLGQVFAWPIALLLFSLSGLVLGLTGDGARDVVSWALLFIPAFLATRFWLRAKPPASH